MTKTEASLVKTVGTPDSTESLALILVIMSDLTMLFLLFAEKSGEAGNSGNSSSTDPDIRCETMDLSMLVAWCGAPSLDLKAWVLPIPALSDKAQQRYAETSIFLAPGPSRWVGAYKEIFTKGENANPARGHRCWPDRCIINTAISGVSSVTAVNNRRYRSW